VANVDGVDADLAAEPEPLVPAAQPEPEPALVGAGAPASAPSAGGSAAGPDDDLKRIEGIGPKMSAALHTAGIRTFRQLSESDVPTLRAAIQAAGLRFAPSLVTWGRQARLLADGDEDGFNVLTKQLIAGRETRRG
jgi:predicted flap endonuclease-1-like 5' DNA nuclease